MSKEVTVNRSRTRWTGVIAVAVGGMIALGATAASGAPPV
jgi:hypothetical protein